MNKSTNQSLILIFLTLGLIWLRSSWGKLSEGKFVDSLSGTVNKMATGNPFPWYKEFLQNMVLPNSKIFAGLIMWGEFLTAATIIISALFLLFTKAGKWTLITLCAGLLGGAFLNLIFWLTAGYSSPSTDSLNLIMLAIEISGLLFTFQKISTSEQKK